ncbi:hypothetical protein [Serratia marcescens]|uniref:hypothetical protein n=1 Tax=Serratia marcescens TaxID=615 RepID=UPI001114C26E|nr:hypothetical protein [Serratia marcescens]
MGHSHKIDDCAIQILICIDENLAQEGTIKGIYLMDNQLGNNSAHSALPSVATTVAKGDKIYWRITLVDPNSGGTVGLTEIGNCRAWGFSGQPEPAYDNPNAYTGEAEESGSYSYNIAIELVTSDGDGMTLSVPHNLHVI